MDDYRGRARSVYDGDTVRLDLQVYVNMLLENEACRMYGYNAHRLGTPEGLAARNRLRELLPPGAPVVAFTYGREKYGRTLAVVINHDGLNVNRAMVDEGHGVPYDGTGPRAIRRSA